MKHTGIMIAAVSGLCLGVVLGRTLLKDRQEVYISKVQPPQHQKRPVRAPSVVNGVDDKALRKQIADLERSLALRMEQVSELQHAVADRDERLAALATLSAPEPAEVEAPDENRRSERRSNESYAARMERMRTEEPERYAEMQQRREEAQQRLTQLHDDRQTFLKAVDTSRMDDAQLENHVRLMEALEKVNAFQKQITSGELRSLTTEERQKGFDTLRTIRDLYDQERRYLLEETGLAYGEDGDQFADYIQNVYENTSMFPRLGRGVRGGRERGEGR